jgi:uncharacterized membrane protein YGL010W
MTTSIDRGSRGATASASDEKPLAAVVLVMVGGLLMVLEALLLGEIMVAVAGLLMFMMALLVRHEVHHHVANGVMVFVVVFMSLFFGYGGFYLGALLGAIGGILAVFWVPGRPEGPSLPRR